MTLLRLIVLLGMAICTTGPVAAQSPPELPFIKTETPRVIVPAREAEIFVPIGGQEVAVLRLAEEYALEHGLSFEKNFNNHALRPIGMVRINVTPILVISFYVMGPRGTVYMSSPEQKDEAVWVPHWDGLLALIRESLGPNVRIGPRNYGGFQPSAGPDGRR